MASKESGCESCGSPIEEQLNKQTPVRNGNNGKYCRSCSDEDGNLLPFHRVLKNTTEHMQQTKDLNETDAAIKARALLIGMPAWHHILELQSSYTK